MTRFLIIAATFLFLSAQAVNAQDRPLKIDLAQDHVDITTGFNGASVIVFGTRETGKGDLVIVLKGPERKVIVRQKKRVMGAWMNRNSVEFRGVPSYYDFASTVDQAALENAPALAAEGMMGANLLDFYAEDPSSAEQAAVFRDILVSRMQEKGLFPLKPRSIEILSDRLFKAKFDLPPGVPTGLYIVEAALFNEDVIMGVETRSLRVGQVGFNARVFLYAQNHSLFYGITAVAIAILSGWAAFTFLRRD
jgi:uncharacterized protein (TIGR02186 family)